MREPTFRGDDVALFIDWENFKISLAAGQRTPNLSSLKEEVSEYGRIVVSKAYADWVTRAPELRGASQFINDPPSLYAAGIEPVFVPTRSPSSHAAFANGVRTSRIKNSVDVKMTADCIECAHSYANIGTFVLVSGDSDFIHVVNALRTMGKRVVVVGVSWSTSRRLADQVDSLVLYDVDIEPPRPIEPVAVATPVAVPSSELGRSDLPEVIRAIEEIIRDERAAGGNPLLTSIKQRLTRRYPNFDEKKLGFSGFKKLMARAAEDGNIKLITAGLVDWAIMADEDTPDGASEESPQDVVARGGRRRGGRRPRIEPQEGEAEAVSETTDASLEEDEPDDEVAPHLERLPEVDGAVDEADGTLPEVDRTADEADVPQPPEEPQAVFGDDEELAGELQEALASLSLPPSQPEDGRTPERVSDLVVMADTLEHREGVSHVAFNFLVSEICDALSQGLEAEAVEITQRWGASNSRTYVSRMLRGLSDGGFFQKGTHSWRDEEAGQTRRRRTFNLNRENALVGRMLEARLGAPDTPPPPDTPHSNGRDPVEDDDSAGLEETAVATLEDQFDDDEPQDPAASEGTAVATLEGQFDDDEPQDPAASEGTAVATLEGQFDDDEPQDPDASEGTAVATLEGQFDDDEPQDPDASAEASFISRLFRPLR